MPASRHQFSWNPADRFHTGSGFWSHAVFPHAGTAIHIFQRPNRLITDGFYSICRIPMYFGLALAPFGLAIKVNAPITCALAAASALVSDF
ncbi:methyltransferase family protein [Nitratireductor arenosus]|uniref:methyltransferase family protein n=1 Tax=Nitratireductor arenosus TaxID=2682096 RepID=UPI0031B59B0A